MQPTSLSLLSLRFIRPSVVIPSSVFVQSQHSLEERWPFPLNHRYRKLILSSRECADTHSLMIDWNPVRSGSLTVRQHQSWCSQALHRNPMKENPPAEVGSKERNRAWAQGKLTNPIMDQDHDRLQSILPPDIFLWWRSLFFSFMVSHFSKLTTKSLVLIHTPPPRRLPVVS